VNLYVIHHRQNLIVLKNPLQDAKINADTRVGENYLIHNAVRWRNMCSLESYQQEFPCVSVSHCDFTSPNAESVNCISLKNMIVKEVQECLIIYGLFKDAVRKSASIAWSFND